MIAPYRSRPVQTLVAVAVAVQRGGGSVLALSPNGAVVAVSDAAHGVCLRSVPAGVPGACAELRLTGKLPVTAAFSPDGQTIAVGQDVVTRGGGPVWLVDTRTGRTSVVPMMTGPTTPTSRAEGSPAAGAAPVPNKARYTAMIWNAVSGHLLLISTAVDDGAPSTRVVDVDPHSLIPRVVAQATSSYDFQSGYLAGGGPKVIFTVYRGDQILADLVVVDLGTGVRKEFDPLGLPGTQIVPLAVSPDGRVAVVGSATYGHSGPPRLLDLRSGRLTDIPGLVGDFALASFSPNGSQVAVVSNLDSARARIAVASVSGGAARTLSDVRAQFTAAARLTWSGLDVLSVTSPVAMAPGSVVGWALSG